MTEADIEIILKRAKERYLGVEPWIISDDGPPLTVKGFKECVRISGMTQVRTSECYPQSNGKVKRGRKLLNGSAPGPERRCRWNMRGVRLRLS
jgi:putative transposase